MGNAPLTIVIKSAHQNIKLTNPKTDAIIPPNSNDIIEPPAKM
jgi:hypothetical protein